MPSLFVGSMSNHSDSYQYERTERFGVSQQWIALKRLGIFHKKTFKHPKTVDDEMFAEHR